MKECIACAEEIKENAKLCRHCGTRQDDKSYVFLEAPKSAQDCWNSISAFEKVMHNQSARELFAARSTSLEILAQAAKDHDYLVRQEVAKNPSTTPELLTLLARDEEDYVRRSVAMNPSTRSDLLALLAKDEFEDVRAGVAINPSVTPELLALLAKDEEVYVRRSVAENSKATPDLLKSLAKDEYDDVQQSVAENPSSPPAALKLIAQHNRRSSFDAVRNANATVDVLIQALKGFQPKAFSGKAGGALEKSVIENYESVQECLDSVSLLEKLGQSRYARLLYAQRSASREILNRLAHEEDEVIRSCVAGNPNSGPELLQMLSRDGDDFVRMGVAKNPSTTPELLTLLARDEKSLVRDSVAGNVSAHPALLTLMAKDDGDVRKLIANNPSSSQDLLAILAKDDEALVRVYVSQNPSTSLNSLRLLARDNNPFVRKSVAENFCATLEVLLEVMKGFELKASVQHAIEGNPISKNVLADPSGLSSTIRDLVAQRDEWIEKYQIDFGMQGSKGLNTDFESMTQKDHKKMEGLAAQGLVWTHHATCDGEFFTSGYHIFEGTGCGCWLTFSFLIAELPEFDQEERIDAVKYIPCPACNPDGEGEGDPDCLGPTSLPKTEYGVEVPDGCEDGNIQVFLT